MVKLPVTAQQRTNVEEALRMWATVPPANVFQRLGAWTNDVQRKRPTCGTHACFGGWCAWWPAFRAQGVKSSSEGAPIMKGCDSANDVSARLFGHSLLFVSRGGFSTVNLDDQCNNCTDHEVVTRRLTWLLENSEVMA